MRFKIEQMFMRFGHNEYCVCVGGLNIVAQKIKGSGFRKMLYGKIHSPPVGGACL